MQKSPLQLQVEHIYSNACFDIIVDIKKAITTKDDATALVHLGELREMLSTIKSYVETLAQLRATGATLPHQ